jgi:pantothenate kinase type III
MTDVLAIDLGGTRIKWGVVRDGRSWHGSRTRATCARHGQDAPLLGAARLAVEAET